MNNLERRRIMTSGEGINWLEKLKADYMSQVLTGRTPIRCNPKYMESDGRTRNRMVRLLWEEGYILDVAADGLHVITDRVYHEIIPEKPDLIAIWDINRKYYEGTQGRYVPAINFTAHLTLQQQKWILENRGDYIFSLRDKRITMRFDESVPFTVGDFNAYQETYTAKSFAVAVFVADTALFAHVDNVVFESEVKRVLGHNLPFTLVKLGLVPEPDKNTFGNDDMPSPFTDSLFGTDPAKWPTEMRAKIKYLADSIARRAAKLSHLIAAQQKIEEFGGWDVLLEKHAELIRQHMREKQESQKPAS